MKKKKLLSIVLSAAMIFSMSAVGAFAAEGDETVSYISEEGITLIGTAPFAGARNVAPGSNDAPQPVRVALDGSVSEVVANINDADATNDYIKVMNGTSQLSVTASADGNIVVLTPVTGTRMASGTDYEVDFSGILDGISGYSFRTSTGGTGGGTGTGTGGGQGSQALTLTGRIPFDGATVASGQNLYAVFSNSLKSSTNPSLETTNESQVSVVDTTTNQTVTSCTVDIIDNWTVKISTSGLVSGRTYNLNIGTLTANSEQTYTGTPISFVAA